MQISKAVWQPFLMTMRLYRLTFAQFIFVPRDFGGSKGHKQGQKVFLLGLVVIINADLNTKYFFTSDNLCLRDGWKDMKQFLIFVGPRFGKFHSIRRKNLTWYCCIMTSGASVNSLRSSMFIYVLLLYIPQSSLQFWVTSVMTSWLHEVMTEAAINVPIAVMLCGGWRLYGLVKGSHWIKTDKSYSLKVADSFLTKYIFCDVTH